MTGVFYVSSGIVEKISNIVIEEENISDYVKIKHPRYESLERSYSSEEIYDIGKHRYNIVKNWVSIKKGDEKIKKLSKSKLHLFAPHSYRKDVRMIMSHERCEGFSFMEEGLMSYCPEERINKKVKPEEESFGEKIEYLGRLGGKSFYRKGCKKRYCVHKSAFPNRKKEKLEIKFGKTKKEYEIEKESCIFICESIPEDIEVGGVYLASLAEALRKITNKYNNVYFKLHPDNYNNWQGEVLRNMFCRHPDPTVEIRPKDVIEDVIIKYNLDVFLNLGSTGLYCGLFSDCNVYSFYSIFSSISSGAGTEEDTGNISSIADCAPDVFWENVTLM